MNRKGFTLIELILVIAILGILAVSALPKFLNLSSDAETAAQDGVVGAVRSGIALYRANDMVTSGGTGSYPTSLETGSCCFNSILTNPVTGWSTTDNVTYTCTGTANTFNYNSTNGTFVQN
ncbi:MAG: type II secretion system protein [Pseudomonadota bacterium]